MKRSLLLVCCFLVFIFSCVAETARDWSEIYLGINPSVSPDGSFFAFEWKDRVWLAPTEGGVATPIGDGMSADSRPFLSPDGKRVAFLSDRWGTLQLFEAELDEERLVASGARQVTFHTEGLYPWGYTPDGADMIALAYRDDASESASSKRLCAVRSSSRWAGAGRSGLSSTRLLFVRRSRRTGARFSFPGGSRRTGSSSASAIRGRSRPAPAKSGSMTGTAVRSRRS